MNLLSQTVTITPRNDSETDDYGSTKLTDGTSFVTRGLAQQTDEIDNRVDGDQATGQWWLFLPAGTSIDRSDRAEVGGVTLEVVGRPRQVVRGTTGQVHHIEAKCRLVQG